MNRRIIISTWILLGGWNQASFGLDVAELTAQMQEQPGPTIIDVRPRHQYTAGHIPGAINIPASLVQHKKLPPLGVVVVYGDGIDPEIARKSTEQLNRLSGIQAEQLEGGMGAWETTGKASTQARGMRPARVRHLSYEDLQRIVASNSQVVLMDLRTDNGEVLSDIKAQFPEAVIVRPDVSGAAPDRNRRRQEMRQNSSRMRAIRRKADRQRLFVLIDDGDGAAEATARRLRGSGIKRIAVLAGGEQILLREGKPGRKVRIVKGDGQ
ncbi:MAG: rhodanese-like domain-containing protein [Gammaproteobacteria bacterium]|nr:rhodanese-like domain-containing protein [Gammaproteobacteria bacterium]